MAVFFERSVYNFFRRKLREIRREIIFKCRKLQIKKYILFYLFVCPVSFDNINHGINQVLDPEMNNVFLASATFQLCSYDSDYKNVPNLTVKNMKIFLNSFIFPYLDKQINETEVVRYLLYYSKFRLEKIKFIFFKSNFLITY